MAATTKRRTNLNSLWCIFYCILVLVVHIYTTYSGITKYNKLNNDSLWGGSIPGAFRAYLALIILSILFLPLFVFTSVLKVGNCANDGTKLGRDHALDCSNTTTLASKLKYDWLKRLWEKFPPFSPVLHLLVAFLVLLPEVILNAAEVRHGLRLSDSVWSCDLDFLFDEERSSRSNLVSQANLTVLHNASFYVMPTPKPPPGGWKEENPLHVSFVHLSAGLFVLTVKYASVFWFTNKVLAALFAMQLLFMTLDSMFAFCGMSVLYKISVNSDLYKEHLHVILNPGAVLALFIIGGIVLLLSSLFLYDYGANYFQEKFKIIDKHHHPETYRKQTIIVHCSCQGYRTHALAMMSLIFVATMKGPILYDLVSLYKHTKDPLLLSCIIIDVCYMVSWIILWTILTLKQQWQFRILDYVPLDKPVYVISKDPMIKSASYHGGSLELHQASRKRPSSLPSDLTTSESGFGDVNSSEDERERFELSLPPLAEIPGLQGLEFARKKGSSTHSLDRKGRNRRNAQQRVTFHETVKRSSSSEDNLSPRQRKPLNITADVHRNTAVPRSLSGGSNGSRSSTPIDVESLCTRNPGYRHSLEETVPHQIITNTMNNQLRKTSNTVDNRMKQSDILDKHHIYKDFDNKTDYSSAKSNLTSANIHTQTVPNNSVPNASISGASKVLPKISARAIDSPPSKETNFMIPQTHLGQNNRLQPRALEFIDKKQEIGLKRRDSANYSLTSSQETASDGSDHAHQQALCSQEKREPIQNSPE